MRQGQQNRRGRGRSRKPQNPLARNYESNGPDVKIRGTASHIAEKYMSLARDALASGDSVSAESYLQHAEHYNRIIMAAHTQAAAAAPQAREQSQGQQANGSSSRGRQDPSEGAEGEATETSGSPSNDTGGVPSAARGRGRGRQRRNGADAATDTQASPDANGGPETTAAAEKDGAEQPVDAGAVDEGESASSVVS
jgi:hypothetical protein